MTRLGNSCAAGTDAVAAGNGERERCGYDERNRGGLIGQSLSVEMRASDAQLISRSLDEPECFAEVFDRHYGRISAYLRSCTTSDVADELASEVFLIAFRRRADFGPDAQSASPWLFGIAVNLLRSTRRSERRRLHAYARSRPLPEDDDLDDAIARADAERRHRPIVNALASIDHDQREVLLLHAWTDLTYVEIAEALAMPVGTVRSRISRARRNVRRILEQEADVRVGPNDAHE